MYGFERSTGRRGFHGILLIILALLAGAVAGSFFLDGDDTDTLPTPVAFATETATATVRVMATAPTGTPAPPATESLAVGAAVPDFTLPDLFDQSTTYTLSAYRGQPVILNFWASWCVPCRREMPALQQTAARYEADGLVLMGMNQTYLDTLDEARAFVEELGLTFPTTRDDGGATGATAYRVVGIPTTVFITREGEVAHIQIGEMSLEQITTYTEQLIAGEPIQS